MNDVKDVEALFGSRVFTRATMRERLPKNVYKEVIKAWIAAVNFLRQQQMWWQKP